MHFPACLHVDVVLSGSAVKMTYWVCRHAANKSAHEYMLSTLFVYHRMFSSASPLMLFMAYFCFLVVI